MYAAIRQKLSGSAASLDAPYAKLKLLYSFIPAHAGKFQIAQKLTQFQVLNAIACAFDRIPVYTQPFSTQVEYSKFWSILH